LNITAAISEEVKIRNINQFANIEFDMMHMAINKISKQSILELFEKLPENASTDVLKKLFIDKLRLLLMYTKIASLDRAQFDSLFDIISNICKISNSENIKKSIKLFEVQNKIENLFGNKQESIVSKIVGQDKYCVLAKLLYKAIA